MKRIIAITTVVSAVMAVFVIVIASSLHHSRHAEAVASASRRRQLMVLETQQDILKSLNGQKASCGELRKLLAQRLATVNSDLTKLRADPPPGLPSPTLPPITPTPTSRKTPRATHQPSPKPTTRRTPKPTHCV